MKLARLAHASDFDGWRDAARAGISGRIQPEKIEWCGDDRQHGLFSIHAENLTAAVAGEDVSENSIFATQSFLELARQIICHSDSERFALAYRLLWRLQENKKLLQNIVDSDVQRAERLAKDVRRDCHKMKAFVRFRKTGESASGIEQFVSWFEPTHHIVRATAGFFKSRFANMHWSILTPESCAHWDGSRLQFTPGVSRKAAPQDDALEDFWRSYYASIFNPARLKISAMQAEMPKKYWRNLPEAALIPGLIREAHCREHEMVGAAPTQPKPGLMRHRYLRDREEVADPHAISNIAELSIALRSCQKCSISRLATQAIAGEGPIGADLMFVGEQPGDREDLTGRPFVGPAGEVLNGILKTVGIDRSEVYLTNAVKHFKYEPRGKRRLHKRPNPSEISHCRWWLEKEIELVRPKVIVAMGNTAILGLMGRPARVSDLRGTHVPISDDISLVVTYHPSFALRARGVGASERVQADMADDISRAMSIAARNH